MSISGSASQHAESTRAVGGSADSSATSGDDDDQHASGVAAVTRQKGTGVDSGFGDSTSSSADLLSSAAGIGSFQQGADDASGADLASGRRREVDGKETSCVDDVNWRGWLVVFGGFLVHFTLGTIYTVGE